MSSRAIVLLPCIMPVPPTPGSKDKQEGEKGWKEVVQQEGWKVKTAQLNDPGNKDTNQGIHGRETNLQNRMNIENTFFSLWKHKEDRVGWSIAVFLGIKHGKSKRSWISQRGNPRKHKTFDGWEAKQIPMECFHYSLNNTKILTVGLWVTSGWGWRPKWHLLQKVPLFLAPPPAAAHGWGAEPQTPLTQHYSQPATFRFFTPIFLLKQGTDQRRADPAGF